MSVGRTSATVSTSPQEPAGANKEVASDSESSSELIAIDVSYSPISSKGFCKSAAATRFRAKTSRLVAPVRLGAPFTHHRVLDRGVDALSVLGNADLDGIVDRALDGNEDVDEVGTSRKHGGVGGWMKGKDQRDSGIQATGYLEGGSGKTHRLTRTGGGKIVLSAAPSQVPSAEARNLDMG